MSEIAYVHLNKHQFGEKKRKRILFQQAYELREIDKKFSKPARLERKLLGRREPFSQQKREWRCLEIIRLSYMKRNATLEYVTTLLYVSEEDFIMNIYSYVQKYNNSMSHKKRRQVKRKVLKKLNNIQPRVLEAKMLHKEASNKIFKYEQKLKDALILLNHGSTR